MSIHFRDPQAVDYLDTGDNPESITALANSARQYYREGHYRMAGVIYRRALQMSNRDRMPDVQQTLVLRSFLASSVGAAGQYFGALALFEALLPDQEHALAKSPTGQLMLTMLAAIAEFERGIMLERQREGIDIAKAEGRYKGRQPIEETKLQQVQTLVDGGMNVSKAVSEVGIGRRTYYRAIEQGRI